MKRSVLIWASLGAFLLLWACKDPAIPPVVSATVMSIASSSSSDSSFRISWTVTNTGNVPIAIWNATLLIRGSSTGSIAFVQTSSTLQYGLSFPSGATYGYIIRGDSSPYVPYYFDATITVRDQSGMQRTYSQTMAPFAVY